MPRKPGGLVVYTEMPVSHREVLSELLDSMSDGNIFRALEYALGDKFIEILDLCQGDKIEFPTFEEIERRILCVQIYMHYRQTKDYKATAVKFKKTAAFVEKIVKTVRAELEEMDSEYV